jgi:hypothetical protein
MSASYVVDLANTTNYKVSLQVQSGQNRTVGQIVDLLDANTYTQVFCAGWNSGPVPLHIQTSDSLTSGSFTDPTSGLPAGLTGPVNVVSGGIFWANSGVGWGSGVGPYFAPAGSGAPLFASGGLAFGAFQRPHRYARLIYDSGNASIASVPVLAGFMGQLKTTASGGGFSFSPTSGPVNV